MTTPIHWEDGRVPYSDIFNDKYFCQHNGYEDARHVFCDGNDLARRFKALDPAAPSTFTIIETGFGTGLDCCVACQTWDALAPLNWKFRFISLEKYPLTGYRTRAHHSVHIILCDGKNNAGKRIFSRVSLAEQLIDILLHEHGAAV